MGKNGIVSQRKMRGDDLGNKLEWFQTKQKRWLDKPLQNQEKSCNVPAKMWTLPYIASEWNDGFDQKSDPMN